MPNGNGGGDGGPGGIFDPLLGELGAAIAAIIQFLNDLVAALVKVLNVIINAVNFTFGFSFDGLSDVWKGLTKVFDTIFKQVVLVNLAKLWDLYKKLQAWATKLKGWLDRLHAIMKKIQMQYFRKVIQILQRARKILTIFRFFHLKFAQKLDNYLGKIEGDITHYMVLISAQLKLVTTWVNFIIDPIGRIRTLPFLAGFFAALNVTWSGLFGTAFEFFPLSPARVGKSTSVTVTFPPDRNDSHTSGGNAADIHENFGAMQSVLADDWSL
jgi:hypothetical protein